MITKHEKTWEKAMDFWDNRRLPDAIVHTDKNEAKEVMGDELAYIDMVSHETHINEPKIREKVGDDLDNIEAAMKHEIGHHAFDPEDVPTMLAYVDEADRVLKDVKLAEKVGNLVSDIRLNTRAVQKKDRTIPKLYCRLFKNRTDDVAKLYMRTYEKLWNCNGLTKDVPEEIEADADKIEDILRKTQGEPENWPKSVGECAEIFKKYLDNDNNNNPGGNGNSNSKSNDGVKDLEKSLIDNRSVKDMLPCKVKPGDQQVNDVIREEIKPYVENYAPKANAPDKDVKQFKRIIVGTGIGTPELANRWLYSILADKYKTRLPETEGAGNPGKKQEKWREGDKAKSLDLRKTIQKSGRATIPGITTVKKVGKPGKPSKKKGCAPDLCEVYDTSGSMPNPNYSLSIPQICSMAVAHSALDKGRKVAVLNFGGKSTTTDYTSDRNTIDDALIYRQGGGTVIPGEDIWKVVRKNPRPQYIVLISDCGISDLDKELVYLKKSREKAIGGSIFLSGFNTPDVKKLEKIGYEVKFFNSKEDLMQLKDALTKKLYGGTND